MQYPHPLLQRLFEPLSITISQSQQQSADIAMQLSEARNLRQQHTIGEYYLIQDGIEPMHYAFGYVFAPLILANLNIATIYQSTATAALLNFLKHYYTAEQACSFAPEQSLDSLKLFIDLSASTTAADFIYTAFLTALRRPQTQNIVLITAQSLSTEILQQIAQEFALNIQYIQLDATAALLPDYEVSQILFKGKDQQHQQFCHQFSKINAEILAQACGYQYEQAQHLIEDMFYSEHVHEKLSVYAEFFQTRLKHSLTA